MVHKLKDYPLHYETMPSDDLIKKIARTSRSLKLSIQQGTWYARIRMNRAGERVEVAGIAQSPREALALLDKRMRERGLYER